jgi:hypothetical protein
MTKLKIRKKPIRKKEYDDKNEYRFNKAVDLIPTPTNKLICIMLTEDKGFYITKRAIIERLDHFRFRNGKYIIENEGIHISENGVRYSIYFEGVSTPLKMSNIEKKVVEKTFIDLHGKKQKSKIEIIKGLKFDSKVLDIFTNRVLAENFTKNTIDNFQVFILLFCIVNIVTTCIVGGALYFL